MMLLQMESSRKKKEKDKVLEALDVELATAYSHESKAAEDLKIAKENHSKFKVIILWLLKTTVSSFVSPSVCALDIFQQQCQ